MAVIETWLAQDLQKPVKVNYLDGNLFSNNGNGNRIGVVVTNNGESVTLSGTVSGYAVLCDGTTVPCTGSKSGNKASILVPAAAYLPGNIFITVFITDDTTVTTLAAVSSNVLQARTDTQVDPGSVIEDWTETINEAMQAVESASASVETAAANLGQIVATPYASLVYPVPLGKYTYYDGKLYRCIVPIESSENFTAAHWSSATNIGDELKYVKEAINTSNRELIVNVATVANQGVMSTTGAIGSNNGYARTGKIKIPYNAKKVFFPDMYIDPSQTSLGWAIYSKDTGYSQDAFVRGGQTPYITFNDDDIAKERYFAVCGYSNKSSWEIIYLVNDYQNDKFIVEEYTANLTAERYVNYTNGNVLAAPNTNYKACADYIRIPFGCTLILFPEATPQFNAEVGWAIYNKRTGNRPDAYVRGGQTTYIIPGLNERYFSFSYYNKRGTPPSTTKVYFYFDSNGDVAKKLYPAYNKPICFVGDSVTYGYDDDNQGAQLANPWANQVGAMLKTGVFNEGYTGATVGDSGTSGIVAWVNTYSSLPNQFDIVGVMLGVNDCYRRSASYPIGDMTSTATTTFYGALKTFWNGMVHKYPPKNGKKLFCMIYPSVYSNNPTVWQPYYNAIKEVAAYYSIPVLDLSLCSGISPHSDPDHEYWRGNEEPGYYSPHLTQYGADVVAPIIAKFISEEIA